jgi:voltage-gated potassium channel
MFPVTPLGKLIGSVVVILGIGLFALPTGMLASGFAEVVQARRDAKERAGMVCPHCGRVIDGALVKSACKEQERTGGEDAREDGPKK